ncbi:hypothetical protein ABCS02_14110 [Microbacterium sp. X-17]|uniref:hypothetical protein n=1 Tax=Microbacterium sp. X-17 TaxID=3144404 RepID=UPI0031F572BA
MALLLGAAGLLVAAPAQAAVGDIQPFPMTANCYFDAFRVGGGGTFPLTAGETFTTYMTVDGQISGGVWEGAADQDGTRGPSLSTAFLRDDATHVVEWVLNGVVYASGSFSYLTSCDPHPVPAAVNFGTPVCVDGSATVPVDVSLPEGSSLRANVTAITSSGSNTYTDYAHNEMGQVHFDIPLDPSGSTTLNVTEQYRPTLTEPIGNHTFSLPGDCPGSTPTPTPTSDPEPTATPTPSESPTPAATDLSATVSDNALTPGSTVIVTASGFQPNEEVAIWLHSDPVLLATVNASADGTLSQTVTIPADIPLGSHQIELLGSTSGSVWVPVAVTGSLAATGANNTAVPYLLAAGGLALVVGVGAIFFARARRALQA